MKIKINSQKSFTLVELIISIGIIAIIIAIAYPNLNPHREKLDVDVETEKIVAYLRETRDRAIAGQDDSSWGVRFVNISNGSDYYMRFKGVIFSSNTIEETRFLSKRTQFLVPPVNSSTDVIFLKSTGSLNSNKTIVIQSVITPEFTSTIEINKLGQINY